MTDLILMMNGLDERRNGVLETEANFWFQKGKISRWRRANVADFVK